MLIIYSLTGNMRADEAVRLVVSQEKFVWQANKTTAKVEFLGAIEELNKVNSPAATYLNYIPSKKKTLYRYYDIIPLYGWCTNSFVKSEQARGLRRNSRMMLPFEYFNSYATILMGECYKRASKCKKWIESERIVTPRADNKLQIHLKKSKDYLVTFSSEHVAFVAHYKYRLAQRYVDTSPANCSCSTWK